MRDDLRNTVRIIMLVSCALLLSAQTAGAPSSVPSSMDYVNTVKQLGLDGALLLAVGVLYRDVLRKDTRIDTLTAEVTTALIKSSDTQSELRKIIEESTKAKETLAIAIDKMHDDFIRLTKGQS